MGKKRVLYLLLLSCFLCSPVMAAQTEGQTQAEIGFSQGAHEENKKLIRLPQTNERQQSFQLIGMVLLVSSLIGGYRRLSKF